MSPVFDAGQRSVDVRAFRALVVVCLVVFFFLAAPSIARGQLIEGDVVIGEFFEELYLADANSGAVTDILNNSAFEEIFVGNVEALNSNRVILSDSSTLYQYDVSTATTSQFTTLPSSPSEITRDLNGNLIWVASSGVHRIDGSTGGSSLLHEESFFSPSDAVVDQNGNIFITEFFEGLGVVGPNGGFVSIGDFGANDFAHIDIGTDGQLYLASTFGGEFWTVDPLTGQSTLLVEDLFSGLDDIQVDVNGDILFTGEVDSQDGLFRFNPSTAETTNIVDGDNINGGFFSPSDLDIYEVSLRNTDFDFSSVPEPGSACLIGLVLVGISTRRRR